MNNADAIKALRDADNTADVLYICDHKSCKKGITYGADACDPCKHTLNVNHAANFEQLKDDDGRVLAYIERAQPDADEFTKPQAEWEYDSEFTEFGNPYGTYKCSCCGGHSSNKYPYCFWCGTKMKGGAE